MVFAFVPILPLPLPLFFGQSDSTTIMWRTVWNSRRKNLSFFGHRTYNKPYIYTHNTIYNNSLHNNNTLKIRSNQNHSFCLWNCKFRFVASTKIDRERLGKGLWEGEACFLSFTRNQSAEAFIVSATLHSIHIGARDHNIKVLWMLKLFRWRLDERNDEGNQEWERNWFW